MSVRRIAAGRIALAVAGRRRRPGAPTRTSTRSPPSRWTSNGTCAGWYAPRSPHARRYDDQGRRRIGVRQGHRSDILHRPEHGHGDAARGHDPRPGHVLAFWVAAVVNATVVSAAPAQTAGIAPLILKGDWDGSP